MLFSFKVQQQVLQRDDITTHVIIKPPRSSTDSKCIFILSTPGSGSSTMVNIASQCNKECEISGENWGALQALSAFDKKLLRTENQPRTRYKQEVAWKKIFDYNTVKDAEMGLLYTMLNPNDRQCWGFKEIRHGRPPNTATFAEEIEYLATLCDNPKIIFHSRENAMKEKGSSVINFSNPKIQASAYQHSCFNSYTQTIVKDDSDGNNTLVESIDGCVRTDTGNEKTKGFRFFLEDYLNENDRYRELWEYLECNEDPPKAGSVNVRAKKKNDGS